MAFDFISGKDYFDRTVRPFNAPLMPHVETGDNQFLDWILKFFAPFAGEEAFEGITSAGKGIIEGSARLNFTS